MTKQIVLSYTEVETLKRSMQIIDEFMNLDVVCRKDLIDSVSSARLVMNYILDNTKTTKERESYLKLAERIIDNLDPWEVEEDTTPEKVLNDMTADPFAAITYLLDTIDCLRG